MALLFYLLYIPYIPLYTYLYTIFAALMAKAKKKAAKEKEKPIILITNDDGITAPGLNNLVEAVKE